MLRKALIALSAVAAIGISSSAMAKMGGGGGGGGHPMGGSGHVMGGGSFGHPMSAGGFHPSGGMHPTGMMRPGARYIPCIPAWLGTAERGAVQGGTTTITTASSSASASRARGMMTITTIPTYYGWQRVWVCGYPYGWSEM